jgi:predicted transcriptional regulator
MKKYDCNSIFIDIISKRQKLVFIYESKKKYNLCIFLTIIQKEYTKFIKESKELSNTKIIIRIYDSGNQLFDNLETKKIKEFQNSSLYIKYEEFQ